MRFYYEAIGQDPFNTLPITFHIKKGLDDPEYQRFKSMYDSLPQDKTNIWILKPGECTNCGIGISVSKDFQEISSMIEESTASRRKTCIV